MKNIMLAEEKALKIGLAASSIAAAQVDGARIGVKEQNRIAIVVAFAAADSTLNLALEQHNAASSGTSKALKIANNYYVKKGAETAFTKVEVSTATDSYDINPGNVSGIAVFEVLESDLDVNADFNYISASLTGTATARVATVLYVGSAEKTPAYLLDL